MENILQNNENYSELDFSFKEIKYNKMRTFQFADEPELIHIFKIRDNEYMVVYEDAYDLNTGKVEFGNKIKIENKFNIKL